MPGIDSFAKLVLHCDGADGSTTFTDSSSGGKTVTANGNAQVDTAQSKFGGASCLLDGTGDYLSVADSADWDFGSGDFTIDLWFRGAVVTGAYAFVSQWNGTGNQRSWELYYDGSNLNFSWSTTGANGFSVARAWSPSTNTWYHLACVRTGSTIKLFVDGTQLGADGTNSDTIFNGTASLLVGADTGGTADFLNGWVDEVRVSKGTARWTANFTPPTEAYSASTEVAPASLTRTRAQGTPVLSPQALPASLVRTRAQGTPRVSPTISMAALARTRALGTMAVTNTLPTHVTLAGTAAVAVVLGSSAASPTSGGLFAAKESDEDLNSIPIVES